MSRSPARRPTLLPSVRRLWRGSHHIQLGTDPGRAVMLELTDPASARVLDLLDGTRTEQALLRDSGRLAIPPDEVRLIVAELRQAGYVVDAHTLSPGNVRTLGRATQRRLEREAVALALGRRTGVATPGARVRRRLASHVLVTGTGMLAESITDALRRAGVGRLSTNSTPSGSNPSGSNPPDGPARRVRLHAAVLAGTPGPAALPTLALRRVAHLVVRVRDATVVVGPLVRPGVGPCLNCLDLHRLDRDPGWRLVAPQLHEATELEPVAVTTALAGAAYAAEEVLTHLEGGTPRTLGATVEIAGTADTIRRRWSQHPACGCSPHRRTTKTLPPARGGGCFN